MIISTIDRDGAILNDIVTTLQQIKQGGVPNRRLPIMHVDDLCTVSFYVDAAKTNLLFTENSTDHASSFTIEGTTTYYVPPDEKINFAPAISDAYSQATYYVTVVFADETTLNLTYRNSDNLLFQQVIVSSKKTPEFSFASNTAILTPNQQKVVTTKANDDRAYVLLDYDLTIQMTKFQCGLTDQSRVLALLTVNNLIRNALYADRYRNGNATLYDENVNGTFVSPAQQLPSSELFKGSMKLQCCYMVASTAY